MKRSPALQPLSRDHHKALFVALQLTRADESSLAAAADGFFDYFERHGGRHFDIEERLLLPELPGADEAERVLAEHGELRRRAAQLRDDPDVPSAQELGRMLQDHVRFEERVLFPLLEESLAPERLEELGRAVEAAEREP